MKRRGPPPDLAQRVPYDGAAARELLRALDRALVAADNFVSESRRRAERAREEEHRLLADMHDGYVRRFEGTTDERFRVAASRLANLLVDALTTGNTKHVLFLADDSNGTLNERRKRRWAEICAMNLPFLAKGFELPAPLVDQLKQLASETLPMWLAEVDARAAALTPETVMKALNGKARTVEGVAARLACDCNAFGYTNYSTAKDAFRNLRTE